MNVLLPQVHSGLKGSVCGGERGREGDLETRELSEEHFPWKILPGSMKLTACDSHLDGFRFS